MCCLFGLIDYRGTLPAKQKTRLIRELSIAAEVRGTDATGIAYNTVSILMDEFVEEYRRIRYGETDKVIKYFEEELKRIGKKLNSEEEDLTKYNVQKRIINYLDETKEIAAISKEFELREQNALFAYKKKTNKKPFLIPV